MSNHSKGRSGKYKYYLSVVMPTLNEAGNIKGMISSLERLIIARKYKAEIIVVDDSSEDGTAAIAKKMDERFHNIKVIVRTIRDGAGAAHKLGYEAAKGKFIVPIEGDCSCDITDIPRLINRLEAGYDIVVASRYMPGGHNDKFTYYLSYGANRLISLLSGIKVHDFTLSFKAFRSEIIRHVHLVEKDGNPFIVELILKAKRAGFGRITEIPTKYTGKRRYGKTKNRIFRAAFLTFKAVFRITLFGD